MSSSFTSFGELTVDNTEKGTSNLLKDHRLSILLLCFVIFGNTHKISCLLQIIVCDLGLDKAQIQNVCWCELFKESLFVLILFFLLPFIFQYHFQAFVYSRHQITHHEVERQIHHSARRHSLLLVFKDFFDLLNALGLLTSKDQIPLRVGDIQGPNQRIGKLGIRGSLLERVIPVKQQDTRCCSLLSH